MASESSSEPNPLYGGISRGGRDCGSDLYLIFSNSSEGKKCKKICEYFFIPLKFLNLRIIILHLHFDSYMIVC